jgi:hypothetical protein
VAACQAFIYDFLRIRIFWALEDGVVVWKLVPSHLLGNLHEGQNCSVCGEAAGEEEETISSGKASSTALEVATRSEYLFLAHKLLHIRP